MRLTELGGSLHSVSQQRRSRRTTRRSMVLVVVMLLSTLLAACGGGGGTNTSAQAGKVNLVYALWDENEQVGYQKSINEFMYRHPNIHVQIVQNPWDSYWQKLSTEFAGNNAPDVFWDDVSYFPQYALQKQLMDLTPMIQKDHLDLSIYYPELLKHFSYQGKYYGLPKDWDTIALFYNKKIFQQLGVTPGDLTWNPTDGGSFLKLAQQLTLDKNGLHPDQPGFDTQAIKQYGFLSANLDQELYWNYIAMNGGQVIDQPFGQKFLYNQPQSVQALQFLVDLIQKWHVSPPASETNNASDPLAEFFGSGKVAMVETGSWNVAAYAKQMNFPFGIAKLPIGPKGRISVFNGLSDAIYANTPHPQESWELVKWLASPDSQKIIGQDGIVWPAIKSETPLFASYWQKQGIDVSAFLDEAQGQTVGTPLSPAFNEISSKVSDDFNQMFLGQLSVQDATNKAVQDATDAINNSGG